MNQRGEMTLLSVMIIALMTGLILLCSLELQRSFKLIQKRTHLFLCVKETKGEIKNHLQFMGRTNWAIKNVHRAGIIAIFIPGLQGAALKAEKMKKLLIQLQTFELISYLKKINDLRAKGCPLDPRTLITPFKIGASLHQRDSAQKAILRDSSWSYLFIQGPYSVKLEFTDARLERLDPKIKITSSEKGVTLSSLWSSAW